MSAGTWIEEKETDAAYDSVLTEPLDIRDGHYHMNNKPGLGYELNHDFIASHPDPLWESMR